MILGACSQANTSTQSVKDTTATVQTVTNAKTKAVLIYADWCGSCKVLDPTVKVAQKMIPFNTVEFVTLDYTAKNDNEFYLAAEAAGVGKAVKTYLNGKVKTGQLLLVDIDDQTVLKKVDKSFNAKAIVMAVKEAVAAS